LIMTFADHVKTPDDAALGKVCAELSQRAAELDRAGDWPEVQLKLLAETGVYRWFLPRQWDGLEWDEADLARGYMKLAAACLTTTFILTQRSAAVRRIADCGNQPLKEKLLPALAEGSRFATVGISHLTTSRRHLAKPVLTTRETAVGFVLDGYSPWVTGAAHADHVVVGATLKDGQQILIAAPTQLPGVKSSPHAELLALTGSHTGPLEFHGVEIGREWLLDEPAENVMAGRSGTKTGGLQTSALAIGLSSAAIDFLERESVSRSDLHGPTDSLRREHADLESNLLATAAGAEVCPADELRARANSLALRSTQAALAAAKGAGYVAGHPAGRWCREALFFLVWSCPQPVMAANLCELAGLG
jgi:alkylation response protein AidB-like acyl-CoA dehydrogenase